MVLRGLFTMYHVSVLIPCFNSSKYIGETLQSVLAQTFQPLEVIVVDDGSTDDSVGVAGNFLNFGIKLIKQANGRAGAARNRAFEASSGEFVLYLDADDLIAPGHIEALLQCATKQPDTIAMSQWDRFYSDPAEANFYRRATYRDLPGPDWLLVDWERALPMTQPGMFLIPRSLIEREGGWIPKLSYGPNDDFEFFSRIISRSKGIRFAEGAKLFYRSGVPGSLSRRNDRAAIEQKLASLVLGTQHLLDRIDTREARLACANILQSFEYNHYPHFPDFRLDVRTRVRELGGSTLPPEGPPGFRKLQPWIGWRAARRVQRFAERTGLNRVSRKPSEDARF